MITSTTLFLAMFMPTTHHEPTPPLPTYSHIIQAPQTPEAQLEIDKAPLIPVQITTVKHHKSPKQHPHRPYRRGKGFSRNYWRGKN